MKSKLNEKMIKEYDEIFEFFENNNLDWERLVIDDTIKIKTNQETVQFSTIENI